MSDQHGFTLIEMLLAVMVMTIIIGLSLPLYTSFIQRNDLEVTTEQLVGMVRRAESYARAVNTDNAWSVEIQSSTATLFQGTAFASRNTAYDETLSLPSSLTPSGLSEIQFAKWTSVPNTTGNIVLTSSTGDSSTVSVNAKGMVSY